MRKKKNILTNFCDYHNSPDCGTRGAGAEPAGSGPLRTLLGAGRFGPEGSARAAEPWGPPPGLSSLSSPSPPLCSFSFSSAVLLDPCSTHRQTQWNQQQFPKANVICKVTGKKNNIQISACSSQTHSRKRNPVCGTDFWTAVSDRSNQVCHQISASGRSSCTWRIQLQTEVEEKSDEG